MISLYEFFMTFELAIPPPTMKNRPRALIWACALNRKNTVMFSFSNLIIIENTQNNLKYSFPFILLDLNII